MAVKPLNERQLFQMKRVNLEKRIAHYYSETRDSEAVIEYGMAILVLNAITMTNYSFVCKDLIKEIFLTSEPTDKMRNFCLYFYDFFEYNEWENIRDRLFKSRAEFSEWTRMIRPETKYVRAASAPTNKKKDWLYENYWIEEENRPEKERYSYAYHTVFRDEHGKKHKLKFQNADISIPRKKLLELLEILTKLTIFEKNGVRRFAEVVFPECRGSRRTTYYIDEDDDVDFLQRKRCESETL
ncbi:MAG: hypothetical protein ACLTXM_01635 [Enterococcus sp.]